MRFTLDSVPANERAEALRTTLWRSVARLEMDHLHPQDIRVTGTIVGLGPVSMCRITTTPLVTRRTPALVKDDVPPSLFLHMQVAGTCMVEQAGRRAVVVPGQFTFLDTRAPCSLGHPDRDQRISIRLPLADLVLPDWMITQVLAVSFGRDRPLSSMVVPYVQRLAEVAANDVVEGAEVRRDLGRATTQLVRSLIAAQSPQVRPPADVAVETLRLRILDFVQRRLSDPRLDAQQIAAAHNISVRYLYKILAQAGVSLGAWIRAQRLERCREALREPGAADETIAAIAHRWGFGDLTHFARVFRQAYGMSPREFRASTVASPLPSAR